MKEWRTATARMEEVRYYQGQEQDQHRNWRTRVDGSRTLIIEKSQDVKSTNPFNPFNQHLGDTQKSQNTPENQHQEENQPRRETREEATTREAATQTQSIQELMSGLLEDLYQLHLSQGDNANNQ